MKSLRLYKHFALNKNANDIVAIIMQVPLLNLEVLENI